LGGGEKTIDASGTREYIYMNFWEEIGINPAQGAVNSPHSLLQQIKVTTLVLKQCVTYLGLGVACVVTQSDSSGSELFKGMGMRDKGNRSWLQSS
jgi:hypothetical protein